MRPVVELNRRNIESFFDSALNLYSLSLQRDNLDRDADCSHDVRQHASERRALAVRLLHRLPSRSDYERR